MAAATVSQSEARLARFCMSTMKGLDTLQKEGFLTDITLCSGSSEISCHKVVLASNSVYFKTMFVGKWKETHSGKVDVPLLDEDSLKDVVQYLYTGRIELNGNNVEGIMHASKMMEIGLLSEHCVMYMVSNMTVSMCVKYFHCSCLYNSEILKQESTAYVAEHIAEVIKEESFLHADVSVVLDLFKMILACGTDTCTENYKLEGALQWIHQDEIGRLKYMQDLLLKGVSLAMCSRSTLVNTLKSNKRICQDDACYELIISLLDDKAAPSSVTTKQNCLVKSKRANRCIVVLSSHDKWQSEVFKDGAWRKLWSLPGEKLDRYAACATKGGIAIVGGKIKRGKEYQVSTTCLFYSFKAKYWMEIPKLNVARCGHMLVSVQNKLYVMGDLNPGNGTIEILSSLDKKWDYFSFPFHDYSELIGDAIGADIYVFPRCKSNDFYKNLTQVFNVASGTCTRKSDMPCVAVDGSASAFGDSIYIVGSISYRPLLMCYRPVTDCWTILNKPQHFHYKASMFIWENKLVIIGGKNNSKLESETYDPLSDKWENFDIVPDRIYSNYENECILPVELPSDIPYY